MPVDGVEDRGGHWLALRATSTGLNVDLLKAKASVNSVGNAGALRATFHTHGILQRI